MATSFVFPGTSIIDACEGCCLSCPDDSKSLLLTLSGITWNPDCAITDEGNSNAIYYSDTLTYPYTLPNTGSKTWYLETNPPDDRDPSDPFFVQYYLNTGGTGCNGGPAVSGGAVTFSVSCDPSSGLLTVGITFYSNASDNGTFTFFNGSGKVGG